MIYHCAEGNAHSRGEHALSQSVAIRLSRFGGPEVLELVAAQAARPGAGQVAIAHAAVGLNMIDTYYRSGLYRLELPSGLGSEAAGTVIEVGAGVTSLEPGDRVAYAAPAPLDAYSAEAASRGVGPPDRRQDDLPDLFPDPAIDVFGDGRTGDVISIRGYEKDARR